LKPLAAEDLLTIFRLELAGLTVGVTMTVQTHSYEHRGYEIVVTHTPPFFQAAIYPGNPNLPKIDWAAVPIRAANVMGAVALAKERINEVLAKPTDDQAA
jgi:hypothetical protein